MPFLLFPKCFLPILRTSCHFNQIWNCHLQALSVWKSLKSVIWERVKSNRTNELELFQIQTNSRMTIKMWLTLWKLSKKSQETLLKKGENDQYQQLLLFPSFFSSLSKGNPISSTTFNPLPDMPILGFSNLAANKDMTSKIWTNGDTIIWLSRKHCGKRRNCSLGAISTFPTMFLKAVCCWCVKMSIYEVKT